MVKFEKGQIVRIVDEEVFISILDIFFNSYEGEDYHDISFSSKWEIVDIDFRDEIYTCMCKSKNGIIMIEADFVEEEIELAETEVVEIVSVDLSKADLTVDDYLDLINLYDSLGVQESKQYYLDRLAAL